MPPTLAPTERIVPRVWSPAPWNPAGRRTGRRRAQVEPAAGERILMRGAGAGPRWESRATGRYPRSRERALLRHPRGLDRAACAVVAEAMEVWAIRCTAVAARGALLHPALDTGGPWEPYQTTTSLDADRIVVVRVTGGPQTHGWRKLFEDAPPEALAAHLPLHWLPDLELGRQDGLGWFPERHWTRRHSPEEAATLRQHPLFQPPLPAGSPSPPVGAADPSQ